MDLGSLSLKELKRLQTQLGKAIATFEDRRKTEALAELEGLARAKGFSLSELTGAPATRKSSASAPKYTNPADPLDTWTGRGRKPRWFAEALAAGRNPSDLAI